MEKSVEETTSGNEVFRKILLSCGIISTVYYFVINLIVAARWPQYSIVSQTVSELSAIGAPTRTLWISLVILYPMFYTAFGWGVLRSAKGNRLIRTMGILIL